MSLFNMQSMEWTPAAYLVALIAGMLTLSSSMLVLPCLTSCFYKLEPHTQKICKSRRQLEFSHGSHILLWSLAMVGGLVAGAQVTCILALPSMLAWTCYHYSAGGIPHAILNFALAMALAYFGFVPFPMVQPLEWNPAAIFLAILTVLTLLPALPYLVGGNMMEKMYEQMPHLKNQFWDQSEALLSEVDSGEKAKSYRRARELALGAQLLGAGCCYPVAIIAGGAADMCLLIALPVTMNAYCHWLNREHKAEKDGAIFSWIIAAALIYFGIAR